MPEQTEANRIALTHHSVAETQRIQPRGSINTRSITGTNLAPQNTSHKEAHTVKTNDKQLYRHKPHTTNSKYTWDKPLAPAHLLAATLPRFTITPNDELPAQQKPQRSITADIAAALLTLRQDEAFIIPHTTASKPTIHNAVAILKFAFPERHFVATNNEDDNNTTIVLCTQGPAIPENNNIEVI